MKRILILTLIVFHCFNAYSQDCYDRIAKQAVVIDSLKRVVNATKEKAGKITQGLQLYLDSCQWQLATLKKDSAELHKIKKQNISLEKQIQQKIDTIKLLKKNVSIYEVNIVDCKRDGQQNSQKQFLKGQQEVYAQVAKEYNMARSFDELIMSSTKLSVERDLLIIGSNQEARQKLKELQQYFTAQNILREKYNEQKLIVQRNMLNSIMQKSDLLVKLKADLDDYKIFTEGLKKTLDKILEIDQGETANNEQIQKMKLNKILSELSLYIFNYNFNLYDYPYLSNILLEIIKRKQPDANAEISDLLEKL